jgi:hypothetical protein
MGSVLCENRLLQMNEGELPGEILGKVTNIVAVDKLAI